MANNFVMSLGAHWMQSDSESFMEAVGKQIDLSPKELSDQGAGIIEAFDLPAGEPCEGRFSPIGDEFDGVDEEFFLRTQPLKSILLRQIFDLDVLADRFALIFKLLDLLAAFFNDLLQVTLFLLISFHL